MDIGDRAKNEGRNLTGKAKEAAGRARGDKRLENEGKLDQKKSQLKKAGESIKKLFTK